MIRDRRSWSNGQLRERALLRAADRGDPYGLDSRQGSELSTARKAFLESVRYPSLDGLRALSIVPVVFHHATPRPLDGVLGRGPLGVDLFFAISGFLITTLLCRERERDPQRPIRLGAFYARRSLRIFPLYYAVLALFVLHALVLREAGPVRDHFLRSLPVHATYTANWLLDTRVTHPIVFGFGWSLATEEQFYLVWPVVLRFARSLRGPALIMTALLVVDHLAESGTLTTTFGLEHDGLPLRMLRSIAAPICGGALAALALRSRMGFAAVFAVLGRRASAPIALAVLVVVAWQGGSLAVAHLAMVALVVACAIREDHPLAPLLACRPVRFVGDASYGIYLLNVPAVVAVRRALPSEAPLAIVFAASFVVSVGVAWLASWVVERPLLRLRSRLRA
jgi:peptidoglycan/LPS O-acetylase OafA/YrhL